MSDSETLYDIVDEIDQVVGQEPKSRLYSEGLMHRGVNVIFYTRAGMVILQRRPATKKTFPNKLDVTVGGHVDAGETYEQAGLREITEETGLELSADDLEFLIKVPQSNEDPSTGTISNYFCVVYAYNYEQEIEKLSVESDHATEFVMRPIQEVILLTPENSSEYTNRFIKDNYRPVLEKLAALVASKG